MSLSSEPPAAGGRPRSGAVRADAGALDPVLQRWINAYREQGMRYAQLDPLGLLPQADLAELSAVSHGLDPLTCCRSDGRAVVGETRIAGLQERLQQCYCGGVALDVSAVRDEERRAWLFDAMETQSPAVNTLREMGPQLLERLVQAEAWERYVAERFPQAKRFSLQGMEALIPLLDALLEQAVAYGVDQVQMGMPHRGRLNVLANVLRQDPGELLEAFDLMSAVSRRQTDLVYHRGARRRVHTEAGELWLELAPNPSHLQSVQPVVCGMARARQDRGSVGRQAVMALMLHGDAALSGQGVVMETLMMARKPGYELGGVVHVVINNQVGFTEAQLPDLLRSRHCTDVARMVDAPVLRVNADCPELLIQVARIALGYRTRFASDIFIDLIGYRRLGHSESDVPSLSSPLRQQCIDATPPAAQRLTQRLEGQLSGWAGNAEARLEALRQQARQALEQSSSGQRSDPPAEIERGVAISTVGLPDLAGVQSLVARLLQLPEGFVPHPMVRTLMEDWLSMASERFTPVDWRFAENLAYATLLDAGVGVRISGMDVQRGTFFHRLAVWHGQVMGGAGPGGLPQRHVPLAGLARGDARFEVFNSPLSEEAVLGFEYGYSLRAGQRLVVWEAQFGDFMNGAQVYADQYIASGEAKWGLASALAVLLPHGHEGVGPEHSSGFLGRWLALCAEGNLRVCCPSTSAQWYHMLRRQALSRERRPLVVMSPKAVLHEEAASHAPLQALLEGEYAGVLDDPDGPAPRQVERVLVCSGKLFYDLMRGRRRRGGTARSAILRLEQLYPMPERELAALLARYARARDWVWVQEEPLFQGAWPHIRDTLQALVRDGRAWRCVAPPNTAIGAACSLPEQRQAQQQLVSEALD